MSSLADGAEAEESPSSPKEAVQLSHRTPAFCRLSSRVTVSSVVYATDAELNSPGSHATAPPTATTTSPATAATLVPRDPCRRCQIRLNAPMEGSLPPKRAAR
ncbi:hypothetical protein GCM10027074_07760 [Streptomyces deserti]